MINEERKFIHDIASPLGALYILLHSVLEDVREVENSPYLERLERCYKLSKQLNEHLSKRREVVQQQSGGSDY
ncbi:MAG: hypothetical protein ACXWQO_12350 [Bdellovibrionota bacterium]